MRKSKVFSHITIANPKRNVGLSVSSDESIFPYYAGYSKEFAEQLIGTLSLQEGAIVLDPWNGAGTTTSAASQMGLESIGVDLNPVMVIVAKASLLPQHEVSSLVPLAKSIVEQAAAHDDQIIAADPLSEWLLPKSANFIRQLESEINRTLISHNSYQTLANEKALDQISALGAFFYVALFRTTRRLLKDFVPTNPTWVKRPKLCGRKRPSPCVVHDGFVNEVELLARSLSRPSNFCAKENGPVTVSLGNAESLLLGSGSVDTIITSPPYCTRIDYAVATALELAVLRTSEDAFDRLRRSLMGTSTVNTEVGSVDKKWGATCTRFLNEVYRHSSKASQTYYYKNHYQYFSSLQTSITELARVLKPLGTCFMVIQDSYYKDIHNDVPTIAAEMARNVGMNLGRRDDFHSNRST